MSSVIISLGHQDHHASSSSQSTNQYPVGQNRTIKHQHLSVTQTFFVKTHGPKSNECCLKSIQAIIPFNISHIVHRVHQGSHQGRLSSSCLSKASFLSSQSPPSQSKARHRFHTHLLFGVPACLLAIPPASLLLQSSSESPQTVHLAILLVWCEPSVVLFYGCILALCGEVKTRWG
jgi:hypothetical protein